MNRRAFLAAAAAVTFAGASSFAHDNFRVIGTITKVEKSTLSVKNKDAKTMPIKLDKQTEVTRDQKRVDVAELKVGQSVVVDAYGDSEADLLALEIRIVPPIARR
jgi:hypothetical protein